MRRSSRGRSRGEEVKREIVEALLELRRAIESRRRR